MQMQRTENEKDTTLRYKCESSRDPYFQKENSTKPFAWQAFNDMKDQRTVHTKGSALQARIIEYPLHPYNILSNS
jgi:hypothetical protein